MNTKSKIILGIAILIFVMAAFSEPPAQAPVKESTPVQKTVPVQASFDEQLTEEIMDTDADFWTDVDVVYVESTKHVNVDLSEDSSWNNDHLRKSFAYSTYAAMSAISKHPDKVDTVKITGSTFLIDTKGNEKMTIVYRAETSLSDVMDVNWEGLQDRAEPVDYLEPNFASVWWNPVVWK